MALRREADALLLRDARYLETCCSHDPIIKEISKRIRQCLDQQYRHHRRHDDFHALAKHFLAETGWVAPPLDPDVDPRDMSEEARGRWKSWRKYYNEPRAGVK